MSDPTTPAAKGTQPPLSDPQPQRPVSETPLPCPFCAEMPSEGADPGGYFVGCRDDGCEIQPAALGQARPEAIAAWNRRAVSEPCDCDQPREHAFVPQAANATLCAKCGSGPTHEDHRSPSSERVRTAPPQEDAPRCNACHRPAHPGSCGCALHEVFHPDCEFCSSTPSGAPTTTCFVCGSTIDVIERLVHGKRIPECDRCTRTRWNTPSPDPSHG